MQKKTIKVTRIITRTFRALFETRVTLVGNYRLANDRELIGVSAESKGSLQGDR